MEYSKIISFLLDNVDSDKIGLPSAPAIDLSVSDKAQSILALAEIAIGEATAGDYYQSCKDRFLHILSMALLRLPQGARLLDVGNAPGYLAIMLDEAGYFIDGINLSDAWNSTYPSVEYVDKFRVQACDIEKTPLPYPDNSFDAVVFTEVLEHIAITHPREIIEEFKRVLLPGGVVLFSTPNVCNVSNVISLLKGSNIFWDSDIFFGGTDRHNREFAPREVKGLFQEAGFQIQEYYGMNDHANWRSGSASHIYDYLASGGESEHSLMRNTIIGVFEN